MILANRYLNYFLDVPYYYANFVQEAKIDIRLDQRDPAKFLRQLRNENITHLLVFGNAREGASTGFQQWRDLVRAKCATVVKTIESKAVSSRALPSLNGAPVSISLLEIDRDGCTL